MYRKILNSNPAIKDANIVVIDDNEFSRALIQNFFSGLGFNNISTFENGDDALKNIRSVNPDIIITDIYACNERA